MCNRKSRVPNKYNLTVKDLKHLVGVESDGTRIENIKPCPICKRLIKNVGIKTLVTEGYKLDISS